MGRAFDRAHVDCPKVGCPSTLAYLIVFVVRTIINGWDADSIRMLDSSQPAGSVPNPESDSGSWRKYLDLSDDNEGNAEPESSTGGNPGHRPQGEGAPDQPTGGMDQAGPSQVAPPAPSSSDPIPLTSSDKEFLRGVFLAEDQGAVEQQQPGQVEAAVGDQAGAPSEDQELKLKMNLFMATFSIKSPRQDVVNKVFAKLNIPGADNAKREKVLQVMENLLDPEVREGLRTPADAGDELVRIMKGWDSSRD